MNILIFQSNFNNKNIHGWRSFVKILAINHKLIILTESNKSKKLFLDYIEGIECISINDELKNKNYFCNKNSEIYENYKNSNIFIERLSIETSKNSLFFINKNNYEEKIAIHIHFIESILLKKNIKKILMGILDSYQSYIYSIIENVSNRLKIKFIMFQHPFLRGFIYDNQLRYLDKVFKDYTKMFQRNFKNEEEKKIKKTIESYKNYMLSSTHSNYLYKKNSIIYLIKSKIKNKIIDFINNSHIKNYNYININFLKNSDKKCCILLLNKSNNYRNFKFSPYYSISEYLIRSIAISLPPNYFLIVKLHPHDTNVNTSIKKEIKNHSNVKILKSNILLTNILEYTDFVFSQSTTSAIEVLMHYKHLVMFGENLQFFGKEFDVVHRVNDMTKLPLIIDKLSKEDVDKDKINKFMYSLFLNSYSRDQSNDDEWHDFKLNLNVKDTYIKAAKVIEKELKKNL